MDGNLLFRATEDAPRLGGRQFDEGVNRGECARGRAGFVEFADQPVEAAVVDGVLEAGVAAVGAVAEVALDLDEVFDDAEELVGRAEADDITEAPRSTIEFAA